jgi:uncharacterized protein
VHLLTRRARTGLPASAGFSIWKAEEEAPAAWALEGSRAVIHLAGEPVSQRWSPAVKESILRSRVQSTRRLVEGLASMREKPAVVVAASAIGYYGTRGETMLPEESAPGDGWLPDVCVAWEKEQEAIRSLGIRLVQLRIGIVLARGGGALQKMLPPFQFGVGGMLGNGQQWMSWIHRLDMVRLLLWAVDHAEASGVYNAVTPQPVRNAEFTATLGRALRRPALFAVPEFALRLLYGEMASMVLASQRVVPTRLQQAGFQWEYPALAPALRQLLS